MSNENNTLAVELRQTTGTGAARRLRHSGMIPAVIYGKNEEPRMLAVNADAWKVWFAHNGKGDITLLIDGKETAALVQDIQFNHLKNYVVHIDFQVK